MNRKVYMNEKNIIKLHEDQLKLSQTNMKLIQSNYDLLKIMIDRNSRQITTINRVLLMTLSILFIYFVAQLIVGVQ